MSKQQDRKEIERILSLPPEEQDAAVAKIQEAIDTMDELIDRIDRSSHHAALVTKMDQLQMEVRNNPESIPAIAKNTGLSEHELRDWANGEQ